MIELTLEQRQAVAQQGEMPPRAVDPDTHTTYVLILEEIYARVKALLDEEEANQLLRDMYPHVAGHKHFAGLCQAPLHSRLVGEECNHDIRIEQKSTNPLHGLAHTRLQSLGP